MTEVRPSMKYPHILEEAELCSASSCSLEEVPMKKLYRLYVSCLTLMLLVAAAGAVAMILRRRTTDK